MPTVLFDLDGTLSLTGHRQHFVKEHPRDWDAFHAACGGDLPNVPIIALNQSLARAGHGIVIFSGRSDIVRHQTEKWLDDHGVIYDSLVMRKHGDYTNDEVLKERWARELLNLDDILCVFDDRQKVVDMWRRIGLTCLQVAPGQF